MALKISTTVVGFSRYREEKILYVDKTGCIPSLVQRKGATYVFIRPRSFGKTLFLSMLAEFFDITKKSDRLFKGLQISKDRKVCAQWRNRCPVVHLTLQSLNKSTFKRALNGLQYLIRDFCDERRYLLDSENVEEQDRDVLRQCLKRETDRDTLERSLEALVRALSRHHGRPTVVLVDGYDVPVAGARDGGFIQGDEMLGFMGGFLRRALKSDSEHLAFAVLTGCLPVGGRSLFAGIDNLLYCDMLSDTGYEDLFGFTGDEVNGLLEEVGFADRKEAVEEWYGGYRIGGRTGMYRPLSVMDYLDDLQNAPDRKPGGYWASRVGYGQIARFLNLLPSSHPERADIIRGMVGLLAGHPVAVTMDRFVSRGVLCRNARTFWTLLHLAGYLTRVADDGSFAGEEEADDTHLVFPNLETRDVFLWEVMDWYRDILTVRKLEALYDAFWERDARKLEPQLATLIEKFGVCADGDSFLHGLVFLLCVSWNGKVASRCGTGAGLNVVAVRDSAHSRAAVIGIRRISSTDDPDEKVREVLDTVARDFDADPWADGCDTILHVGMAFAEKSCRVGFVVAKPARNGESERGQD